MHSPEGATLDAPNPFKEPKMKSYNVVRLVVELVLPQSDASHAADIAHELENYVPRLQEDMEDFGEEVTDRLGIECQVAVTVESATVRYEE